MRTAKERYLNDPHYHNLVDTLEFMIERSQFTPSELREACILACVNYEMRHLRPMIIDKAVADAFTTIETYINSDQRENHSNG